jgi:phage regulator Rha-like protein
VSTELVTVQHNVPLADSREIAEKLGIGHNDFFHHLIKKYQEEIEEDFSLIRFQNGSVKTATSRGTKYTTFALLTEEQTYAYMSYSRNTEQARMCKRLLVKAFMKAKEHIAALIQPQPASPMETLSDTLRQRVLANEDRVPSDLFAIQIEFGRELYHWEKVVNACLDSGAQIEISVGTCWWNYARSVLHMQGEERRHYQHGYEGGRMVKAWAYPLHYLPAFRQWLREVYFIEKFPAYQRYRARQMGVELGTKPMRLRLPKASSGTKQLSLFV